MYRIKQIIKKIWVEFTWLAASILASFSSEKDKSNAVLLIPAANLDGGFGEDIMITSFIENFAINKPVTIVTGSLIERPDYLGKYNNLTYNAGFTDKINFVKILKLIQQHSLVYVIGADIMDGTYDESSILNRLRILELAKKINVDTQFSGFSISNKILPSVKKKLVTISKSMIIKARDIDSYTRLAKFIPSDRLLLTNDIAFICPDLSSAYQGNHFNHYENWLKTTKQNNPDTLIVAVCPNSIQASKVGLDNYIEGFENLLKEFIKKGKFALVFLYHDLRPLCGSETDSTISQTLYEHLKVLSIDCYYTDQIKNGVELKGYLKEVDFTITGRMHLGISGITYSKPMFGISYANKFEGMVRLFNIDPECCLIEYVKMNESKSIVSSFIDNFIEIKNKTKHQLEQVREATYMNVI